MTASNKTTILITGANRGIGLALTKKFLVRDNTVVIAAVRNPENAASIKSLLELPHGAESALLIIKINSLDNSSAASGIASISDRINHIDLVIANAGILSHYGPVSEIPLEEIPLHIAVNTVAPIALLQATKSLLQNASSPKFVVISTSLGSIAEMGNYPQQFGVYGASKAAINYLMRKVHFEETWLTSMVICPGWTQTDMGNAGAKTAKFGEQAPVPLDMSVSGLVQEIDGLTRTENGRFASFDHNDHQW
ncbi:nadp-binding rossmann-fold containing [Trichoderma arundinaceum]|uniref:Nadp-binding rossmann-fold containing n=1 Tax=Trichoderma arundinaceum TaxID=490622 RepID=A0A395NTI0_TRIAR|nr:nadp-binding rossmann-fold containing [Trichoderma arundinaceum]